MKLSKINSFFSYGLLESKRKIGLSVNEDETDDLADDIKGKSPKKPEGSKEITVPGDDDLPDDITGVKFFTPGDAFASTALTQYYTFNFIIPG